MNKLPRTLAKLIAPWRTIRRLERDNARLSKIIENPLLTGVEWGRERGIEIGMKGSGPQLLAGMFLGFLQENQKNAPNFIEITFDSPEGPILVTVMQPRGATPNDLRLKAESQVRRLQSELLRLQRSAL